MTVHHCTHCGDEASRHCAGCKTVRYCSRECQTADWDWHKLLCKEVANFLEKPGSKKELRRVILLPEKDSKPIFYWMPMDVDDGDEEDDDKPEDDVDVASDLGVPVRDAKSGSVMPGDDDGCGMGSDMPQFVSLVVGTMGHGEPLDHSLKMMCKDDLFDLAPNPGVARLLGGGEVANNFRGPLVILRMTKVEDSANTLDIDASDFTLALDGLAEYVKKQANSLDYFANGGAQDKKVPAVKINTDIPYYEEIKILRKNSIFASGGMLSPLTEKIGLALRTTTAGEKVEAAGDTEAEDNPTSLVAYLHICIDTASADFGTIPESMKDAIISTLVVKADKTAISISALVDLCEFIKDDAEPILITASKLSVADREKAVDSVVQIWKERAEPEYEGSDSESEEDDEEYEDGGDLDDLADLRAKMGQMQMASVNARTGAGLI